MANVLQILVAEVRKLYAKETAGVDVKRTLIKPIATSRDFTPKLLKYLIVQPCAYRRFTSYIAQ
jgi:hypothetical protein